MFWYMVKVALGVSAVLGLFALWFVFFLRSKLEQTQLPWFIRFQDFFTKGFLRCHIFHRAYHVDHYRSLDKPFGMGGQTYHKSMLCTRCERIEDVALVSYGEVRDYWNRKAKEKE